MPSRLATAVGSHHHIRRRAKLGWRCCCWCGFPPAYPLLLMMRMIAATVAAVHGRKRALEKSTLGGATKLISRTWKGDGFTPHILPRVCFKHTLEPTPVLILRQPARGSVDGSNHLYLANRERAFRLGTNKNTHNTRLPQKYVVPGSRQYTHTVRRTQYMVIHVR